MSTPESFPNPEQSEKAVPDFEAFHPELPPPELAFENLAITLGFSFQELDKVLGRNLQEQGFVWEGDMPPHQWALSNLFEPGVIAIYLKAVRASMEAIGIQPPKIDLAYQFLQVSALYWLGDAPGLGLALQELRGQVSNLPEYLYLVKEMDRFWPDEVIEYYEALFPQG